MWEKVNRINVVDCAVTWEALRYLCLLGLNNLPVRILVTAAETKERV